jgi:2-hydroxychromene-2-carboxylate isomerase
MRLPAFAAEAGINFIWRPFNVRAIMIAQDNIPFAKKPVKAAYMWRDIARRAAKYRLHPRLPAPYPIHDLPLANQVALLGMQEGWGIAYTIEPYRLWFEQGEPAGSQPNLSESLRRAGQDPQAIVPRAASPDVADALGEATAIAMELGIFGSPSFVVEGEVFWGDDRLEDAVSWRRSGRVG